MPLAEFPIEGNEEGCACRQAGSPGFLAALSDVDCFHPSEAMHARLAAAGWNRLTLDAASRAETIVWEDVPKVRCLEAGDRIQTTEALAL